MMPGSTEETTEESVTSSRLTELLRKNLLQDHIHGHADKYGVRAEGRDLIATCGVSHFLTTRFNIWDESLRRGAGILEPDAYRAWLTRRIRIFNELLLPTIVSQTFQGFHYLLVLDTERDETLDAFLDHLSPYQMIRPVFIDLRQAHPWSVYEKALGQEILALSKPGEIVATTRLDSDDAINVDFMSALNRYCTQIEASRVGAGMYLNFPLGLQINGTDVSLHVVNRNPFQTMLESREKYLDNRIWTRKGVFQTAHNRTDKVSEVVNLTTRLPMWAQFVHGGNVANVDGANLLKLAPSDDLDLLFAGVLSKASAVR